MNFIFKWFKPSVFKRPLLEINEEKEYREAYYAKTFHEVQYKNTMTELLKKTAKKRYKTRSLKQHKQQIEYGRLENWLTKVEKYQQNKNL